MDKRRDLHLLRIGKRTFVGGPRPSDTEVSVFCPVREASVQTGTCATCRRRRAMHHDSAGGFVVCEAGIAPRQGTCDVGEAAARVPLGAFMNGDVVAVREDASVTVVAELFLDRGVGCVPVVDGEGGVTGIITRTDLLRAGGPTARDVMTLGAYCLPEDARLSHAFALMAAENVAHVPIVTSGGTLVGVVSAEDATRWVAGQLGYVTPDDRERRGP